MFLVPMDFFQSKAIFFLLILQNIFFCVQKKKETPTGLEQLEGVKYSIQILKKDVALPDTKFSQVLNMALVKYEAYFSFHLPSFFNGINNDKVS